MSRKHEKVMNENKLDKLRKKRGKKQKNRRLTALKRQKLIDYLANPDNPPLTRCELSTKILGYTHENTIYNLFSPDDLIDIEWEALDLRRKRYARKLMLIDMAVMKRAAAKGDPKAAKLAYQRFENWIEKKANEHTGKDGKPLFPELTDDLMERIRALACVDPDK